MSTVTQGDAGHGKGVPQWVPLWAALILAALAFSWVMIWNGYPILYGDTGGYLQSAIEHRVQAYRPSGYPLVMGLAAATHAIWPVAALQALLMAYLFVRLAGVDLEIRGVRLLILVLAVSALTTLPWWAVTALSDIWSGAVAVSVYLLLFRWPRLRTMERLLLGALLALALTFHISYPIIIGGTMAAVLCLHLAGRVRILAPVAGTRFYRRAHRSGRAFLSPGQPGKQQDPQPIHGRGPPTPCPLRGRRPRSGHAQRTLSRGQISPLRPDSRARGDARKRTAAKRQALACGLFCRGLHQLDTGLRPNLSRAPDLLREGSDDLRRVLLASVRHDPVKHVTSVIGGTWDLLFNNAISPFIDGMLGGPGPYLAELSPSEQEAFDRSRAARGKLYTSRVNLWLGPTANVGMLVCLAALVILLVRGQEGGGGQHRFGTFVRNASYFFIFCVTNAVVMYAFVGDHTRYQSRCSWMMAMQPLVLCLLLAWPRAPGDPANRNA